MIIECAAPDTKMETCRKDIAADCLAADDGSGGSWQNACYGLRRSMEVACVALWKAIASCMLLRKLSCPSELRQKICLVHRVANQCEFITKTVECLTRCLHRNRLF